MPNDDSIKRSDALKAILGLSIYDTIEELEGARTIAENTWADGLWDAYKIIEEEVDAADVEPVRHGRWKKSYADHEAFGVRPFFRYCSECHEATVHQYNYCPNCGAKMIPEPLKEEEENDNKNL